MLVDKYGITDMWRPNEVKGIYERSFWKGMQHMEVYLLGLVYKVGIGDRVAF